MTMRHGEVSRFEKSLGIKAVTVEMKDGTMVDVTDSCLLIQLLPAEADEVGVDIFCDMTLNVHKSLALQDTLEMLRGRLGHNLLVDTLESLGYVWLSENALNKLTRTPVDPAKH